MENLREIATKAVPRERNRAHGCRNHPETIKFRRSETIRNHRETARNHARNHAETVNRPTTETTETVCLGDTVRVVSEGFGSKRFHFPHRQQQGSLP
jgi:hypothetical protein